MSLLKPSFAVTLIAAGVLAVGVAAAQQPQQRPPAAAPPAAAPPPVQLPNGATAINETYGDWTVDCRIVDNRKACVLVQSQGNSQTGQRTFAIELRAPEGGKTEGTLLLPFGLSLDTGVKLKVDDKDLGSTLRFSTCVPAGCLALVSFPTATTEVLKKGTTLVVSAVTLRTGEPVAFSVSLNGFSAAITRASTLGG
jgi:invasion protein IalB